MEETPLPHSKPKNWPMIGLGSLLVILLATSLYLAIQNYQLKEKICNLEEQTKVAAQPIVAQPTITSIPTSIPTSNPTANWQVYRNQEYGYEIKYPKDWEMRTLVETESKLNLEFKGYPSPSYPAMLYLRINKGEFLSVQDGIKEIYKDDIHPQGTYKGVVIPNNPNFEIAPNKPAFKVRVPGGQTASEIAVFFLNDGNLFGIFYSPADDGLYESKGEEILATFKFLE